MNKAIVGTSLILLAASTAFASVECSDLQYGGEKYHASMEQLAREARFHDNYYNRFHEDAVRLICNGKMEEVKQIIDQGDIKSSEVEAIKEVLGKDERTEKGKSYGYSKQRFSEMGLCNACADNVAQYYTREAASKCGKLAKSALEGNPRAIKELQTFPSYCVWKY